MHSGNIIKVKTRMNNITISLKYKSESNLRKVDATMLRLILEDKIMYYLFLLMTQIVFD